MPYARVLLQSWPWGTFGDKQNEKNLVNDALVTFSSFSAQQLPSLTIYLKDLLENLSHENKTIVIMGDFNIDLLKYDTEKDSADFLDSMYASFLLPYISTPFRVTPRYNQRWQYIMEYCNSNL